MICSSRAALAHRAGVERRQFLAVEAHRAGGRLDAAAARPCAVVVLPQPDSPTRPSVSPRPTSKRHAVDGLDRPARRRSQRRRRGVVLDQVADLQQRCGAATLLALIGPAAPARGDRRPIMRRLEAAAKQATHVAVAQRASAPASRRGSASLAQGQRAAKRAAAAERPAAPAPCRGSRPAARLCVFMRRHRRHQGRGCRDAAAGRTGRGDARFLDLAAGVHHHHAVAALGHHAEVVGDQHASPMPSSLLQALAAGRGSAPGW